MINFNEKQPQELQSITILSQMAEHSIDDSKVGE